MPHLGYLSVTTEPFAGVTVTHADSLFTLYPTMQLPVKRYDLNFTKRGYYPETRRYDIKQGETLTDTVVMRKIQYVKKTTGYASVAFTVMKRPEVTFAIGGMYENVNLEASYAVGLGRSEAVRWYDRTDQIYQGSYTYRINEFAVKAGYQLRFAERFGLTPQLGWTLQRLYSRVAGEFTGAGTEQGLRLGNGFTQSCLSIGARCAFHPIPNFAVFVTPEYAIPLGGKGDIKEVYKQGDMIRGGFRASFGISVSL